MIARKAWDGYDKIKCDCGHYPQDHHAREGWCNMCGCTWYHPNIKYIKEVKGNIRLKIPKQNSH